MMSGEKTVLKKFGLVSGAVFSFLLLYFGTGFLPVPESDGLQTRVIRPSLTVADPSAALSARSEVLVPPVLPTDPPSENEAPLAQGPIPETPETKAYRMKKGDSLYIALAGFGVADREIREISRAIKPVYDLRRIQPGQTITVSMLEGSDRIDRLVYEIDLLNRLKVERSEGQYSVFKEEVALERELTQRSGTITDSLYTSGVNAGVPVEVIMNLADIFAWDLDFGSDIHPGDEFALIFEVYKKDGKTVRYGRVLAAEIVNRRQVYRAYYFSPPGGAGDYYEESGRSLRKAFLKSPLRYRYISSGYASRRLHPILKINRPHLGIDFAARHGTPVRAAADGVISFVGWKGGHGKTVMIRHGNGYKTLYGHLSSFWPGLKKGKRVKQEDFIGRVGSTGLSTGPHLHYTMIKDGKAINPKVADRLRGEALAEQWHPLFSEQVHLMNQLLDPVLEVVPENEST